MAAGTELCLCTLPKASSAADSGSASSSCCWSLRASSSLGHSQAVRGRCGPGAGEQVVRGAGGEGGVSRRRCGLGNVGAAGQHAGLRGYAHLLAHQWLPEEVVLRYRRARKAGRPDGRDRNARSRPATAGGAGRSEGGAGQPEPGKDDRGALHESAQVEQRFEAGDRPGGERRSSSASSARSLRGSRSAGTSNCSRSSRSTHPTAGSSLPAIPTSAT